MLNSKDLGREKSRKPYEKPTATKLSPDEAKRKLVEGAKRGDRAAEEMLMIAFPQEAKKLLAKVFSNAQAANGLLR